MDIMNLYNVHCISYDLISTATMSAKSRH